MLTGGSYVIITMSIIIMNYNETYSKIRHTS